MADIQNTGNLSKLYLAQLKLDAYNNYLTTSKKGEEINETLFNAADTNGDGKITSADKTAINKEINKLNKDKNLFDISANDRVNVEDLIMISGDIDLDGDGEISESEIAFLEEQEAALIKKLKNNSAKSQMDINGDGKVDMSDLEEFMNLIDGRDIYNSDSQTDKYLQTLHNKLNYKLLNYSEGHSVDVQDLAIAEQRLAAAKGYLEGGTKYNNMSTNWILKSDLDNNKTIDENDVKLLELAIDSLQQQLKVTGTELGNIQANYETLTGEVNSLTKQSATDKTAMNNLKNEVNKLQKKLTSAQRNAASADKKATDALIDLTTAEANYNDNMAKLEEYEQLLQTTKNSRQKRIYKSEIDKLKKATDLEAKKAALETAQTNQANANTNLETIQQNLDTQKTEYLEAEANYTKTNEALNTKKDELKTASADYKKYQYYYSKTQQVQTNHIKDIAKNTIKNLDQEMIDAAKTAIQTDDTVLQTAFDNLTDQEKVLIDKLNIDLTETFADGSPKYVLAKGSKDKQYHVYQFKSPGATSAQAIIRSYAPNGGNNIIKCGNGILYIKNGTSTNTDNSIIIPKKVETTVEKEVETTVEIPAEKQLEEVIDEMNALVSDLIQEAYHASKQSDLNTKDQQDLSSKIIESTCNAYLNNEIEKGDLINSIIDKISNTNKEGGEALRANIDEMNYKGQKFTNLTNKLSSIMDSTKSTTQTIKELIYETISKLGSETSTQAYNTASPLSFDLNGDGVKTSSAKTMFDIDGDGKLDLINDSADGVLVFDADGNGIAGENGHEVFGNNTDLDGDGQKDGFANGFDALRALGQKEGLLSENDNTLDASDIDKLQQKYGFGIKSGYNGEVKTLSELGISQINFGSSNETQTLKNFDGNNNELMTQKGATFTINGETRSYADIWHVMYETKE